MSWFQSIGLNSAFDSLTETVQKAKESVHDAIPTEQKELFAKLTLNTEEMISERQNFRDEATRKEQAKEELNKLLPWETFDLEREILVEECKEAILELSSQKETFFGPYEMPLLNVQFEVEDIEEEGNEDRERAGEESPFNDDSKGSNTVEEKGRAIDIDEECNLHNYHMLPSKDSREKLAKLEPLPPLLEDFDLDEHVGLIQKILKEDSGLVNMQATLSGGGAREKVFWRNYFFHCAFTRYEAGLSIDEIWSYQDDSKTVNQQEAISTECTGDEDVSSNTVFGNDGEEAVNFDSGEKDTSFQNVEVATTDSPSDVSGARTDISFAALSEASPSNGFELVDDSVGEGSGDPALDELEAEIARELEN